MWITAFYYTGLRSLCWLQSFPCSFRHGSPLYWFSSKVRSHRCCSCAVVLCSVLIEEDNSIIALRNHSCLFLYNFGHVHIWLCCLMPLGLFLMLFSFLWQFLFFLTLFFYIISFYPPHLSAEFLFGEADSHARLWSLLYLYCKELHTQVI